MDTQNPSAGSRRTAARGIAGLTRVSGAAAAAAVTPSAVPEPKRSKAGLYLEARDVPAFIAAHGGPSKLLFLDVRTRAEAMSMIDGFEGDLAAEGRHDVHGWRKAGLPWSYKLDKAKMHFEH
jgi:hypothetical protein